MKILFFIVFFLFSVIFAEEDYDKAVSQYKKIPQNINEEVSWLKPYNETFLPYNRCGEVESFEITNVDERVDYYWDSKDHLFDINHYYCLVSIVRITYRVSCLNKLQYEGVSYLLSDPKKLNETLNPSDKEVENFKSQQHDWISKPFSCIKSDGKFDEACSEFDGYDGIFDKQALIEDWEKQKVAYPEWKYLGIPGKKLAKPILFVHGLGDDYRSWGVTSTIDADSLCQIDATCAEMWPSLCDERFLPTDYQMLQVQKAVCTDELKKKYNNYKEALLRTNDEFQEGLVKKYILGSAPDIIVRNQNIYITDDNINSDGLYFFQAPGKINEEKRWEEASLNWDNTDAQNSQSRKLYQKLEEILDDFFEGTVINWRETPEVTIDIVAHSQGGLIVREMLRGLRKVGASSGPENPANHIGRVVTVDTPHLGATTAAENAESESFAKYPGLRKIVDDLNNPENHDLVNIKVNLNYADWLTDLGILFSGTFLLGWGKTAAIVTSDYEVNMKGPYLGPYTISLNVDPLGPGSADVDIMEKDFLEEYREQVYHTRSIGKHLDRESDFLRNLNNGTDGVSYPKKPNGLNLEIVPLYSGNTKAVVSAALEEIAENLKLFCPELEENDSKTACVSLESFLESKSNDFEDSLYNIINIDAGLDEDLLGILKSLVDDWLANSDLIVESESQKYESEKLGISSKLISGLKTPREFEFHDALAPWETVTHLDLKMGNMAASARQGLDIACALHLYCDELLAEKAGIKLIYLDDGSVGLSGDFDLSPLYLGVGKQGSRVSDGTNYLEAVYEHGVGSYVDYTDAEGNLQHDIVLSSDFATNPRIQRKGSVITVNFDNQSGKTFSKDYTMTNMASLTTFSIVADEGVLLPRVVACVGNASDLSSQVAPVSPTAWKKSKDVFAMHREARDDYETNTSRPRILVANASENDIEGFKVAYYFTADPARNPIVEVDYPKIPVTLENLGGDQWRFVLDASDSVLKAKSVFPSLDGWQIRIHYSDWFDYKYLDDWSADYNVGMPKLNRKIVLYDKTGHILWGQEPKMFKSTDDGVVSSPKGILSWSDSAPWENNMFKPQVTIKNTGTIALKDYHAKLWFRVPKGKELYIPVDDWYTPVSKPNLKNIGENVWELDMYFDEYMLYPNEAVVERNIGLHLTDWSTFDKLVCGIALIDSEENVIFGKVPSVDECKSYDGESLVVPQYAWGY